jgi:hypothetical protein
MAALFFEYIVDHFFFEGAAFFAGAFAVAFASAFFGE